jgi:hypothetical protein
MSNYKCRYCIRNYKTKYHYERHVSVCQFLSKSPKEKEDDIEINNDKQPSQFEMYQLIKNLSYRIDKLEKENQYLKRRESKKINLLEWLNDDRTDKPLITFDLWLTEELGELIPTVLDEVYKNGLVSGITKLIEEYMINSSGLKHPICSFNKSPNIIYIFDKSATDKNMWKQLSTSGLDIYIEYLCNRFITAFSEHWFEPNREKIKNREKYKETYVNYYQKILASSLTKEARCNQIRQIFMNNIKQPAPSIIAN